MHSSRIFHQFTATTFPRAYILLGSLGYQNGRNHTFLDPDNQREGFWDFTWDEMAHYDLPAMIEKVLELTGETEMFYAGHSMGTTAFMAMHYYRPDIGEK